MRKICRLKRAYRKPTLWEFDEISCKAEAKVFNEGKVIGSQI